MKRILTIGAFDDMRFQDFRFLQEASLLGPLTIVLWSDGLLKTLFQSKPKFPEAERMYLLGALRYVDRVFLLDVDNWLDGLKKLVEQTGSTILAQANNESLPEIASRFLDSCLERVTFERDRLEGLSIDKPDMVSTAGKQAKKVVVTGCYDWFHSGHVAFFEEASSYGELYVIVGNDKNVRLLKGKNHPMFDEQKRKFIVDSIRFVRKAMISTGSGWMDGAPEIHKLKPDVYIVNEDGDVPEKRDFCDQNNIEFLVLKRVPKQGLPKRTSTDLREF